MSTKRDESIPVEEWEEMQKSDVPTSNEGKVKVLVVYGSSPEEDGVSTLIAQEAVETMKTLGEIDVAEVVLPKTRIAPCVGCFGGGGRTCVYPCDRNDIESDIYDPRDGMLPVYEKMQVADVLVLATDVRWCGVNHYTQRFIERLDALVNQRSLGEPVIRNKVAGLVVVGEGSMEAAGRLMSALNAVGYSFPSAAYTAWDLHRNVTGEAAQKEFLTDEVVHNDTRLMAEELMKLARAVQGG